MLIMGGEMAIIGLPFAASASAFNNKPSRETIQCLEDCIFQYIPGKELEELYQKYNNVNTVGRKLIEEYCDMLIERNYSFQTKSAEDRYKDLIKYEPEIIKRVPYRLYRFLFRHFPRNIEQSQEEVIF